MLSSMQMRWEADIQWLQVRLNFPLPRITGSSYWPLPVRRKFLNCRCDGMVLIFIERAAGDMISEILPPIKSFVMTNKCHCNITYCFTVIQSQWLKLNLRKSRKRRRKVHRRWREGRQNSSKSFQTRSALLPSLLKTTVVHPAVYCIPYNDANYSG